MDMDPATRTAAPSHRTEGKRGRMEKSGIFAHTKGQISVFLILAIAILIGGAVFFYLEDSQTMDEILTTSQEVSSVPSQFSPIQGYVEECLARTGEEGLRLIGEQGGYLSVLDSNYRVESFSLTQDPTESDAIRMSASADSGAIAYWWYLKSPNSCKGTCELSSKRPQLSEGKASIETQLETYVEKNIESCFGGFFGFSSQGFLVKTFEKPKVVATIANEDVSLRLTYPIEMSLGGEKHTAEVFGATLDVRIKQLYDLGTQITNLEMQYR